jgi:hypothetical protein
MPRASREEDRLTKDESARIKLGPRGVPGGQDTAKMINRKRAFPIQVSSTVIPSPEFRASKFNLGETYRAGRQMVIWVK